MSTEQDTQLEEFQMYAVEAYDLDPDRDPVMSAYGAIHLFSSEVEQAGTLMGGVVNCADVGNEDQLSDTANAFDRFDQPELAALLREARTEFERVDEDAFEDLTDADERRHAELDARWRALTSDGVLTGLARRAMEASTWEAGAEEL